MDEHDMACGEGVATLGGKQYKGTWFQNKRHGIGMWIYQNNRRDIGEFKEGKKHGKMTFYG